MYSEIKSRLALRAKILDRLPSCEDSAMAGAIEDYILTSELADVEAATRLEEIRAGAVEEDVFGGI